MLEAYATVADDGPDGRLVMVFEGSRPSETWERHPAGDELVMCPSERMTVMREVDGEHEPSSWGRTKR